jgi:hypothetical protein
MVDRMTKVTERVRQSRVVKGLSFSGIDTRCGEIVAAHDGSLDWLLGETGPLEDCGTKYNKKIMEARTSFVRWLRDDPGTGFSGSLGISVVESP